jgi:uncharacterized protein (TIGR00290 family)
LKRALLSWSGGKDCAWALERLRGSDVLVAGLLTTFNEQTNRVAMHAVRRELIEQQAREVGLPLWTAMLPWPCPNERYHQIMSDVCLRAAGWGIQAVVFGDLFLEDIRNYRERMLDGTGLEPLFPLWGQPTASLAREMLAGGLRAIVACIDRNVLDPSFTGREFDAEFLRDLPTSADPCGENGEFHTFAYDGPMFRRSVPVECAMTREEGGFMYTDLQGAYVISDSTCPVSYL